MALSRYKIATEENDRRTILSPAVYARTHGPNEALLASDEGGVTTFLENPERVSWSEFKKE